jgi:hypothetical protein
MLGNETTVVSALAQLQCLHTNCQHIALKLNIASACYAQQIHTDVATLECMV